MAFRTNFIVGFPGETEADFETLCDYVREEAFDNLVVFNYEREPETPSYAMKPQLPQRLRKSRRARLLEIQQQVSRERLQQRIGETMTVMIDGPAANGRGSTSHAARTTGQAFEVDGAVIVEGGGATPGELVPVRVTGAGAYDLFARLEQPAALHVLGSA